MSRHVDINKVLEELYLNHNDVVYIDKKACAERIKKIKSIDIVRCKECKYYDKFPTWSACTYWSGDPYEQASVNDDDFCSYGERREP